VASPDFEASCATVEIHLLADLRDQPGRVEGRLPARPEEEEPGLLHPVRVRVLVQLVDLPDSLFAADHRERRQQRTAADARHEVEVRPRQLALRLPPTDQKPGAECAVVAPAVDDQQIEHALVVFHFAFGALHHRIDGVAPGLERRLHGPCPRRLQLVLRPFCAFGSGAGGQQQDQGQGGLHGATS